MDNEVKPLPRNQILLGDALTMLKALPDESVDMVFSDPPYGKDGIALYEQAAMLSARVLKPGKFCLVMSGGMYQDEILSGMSKHLTFYWTFHVYLSGSRTGCVYPRGNHHPVVTRIKPVHAFVKGWGEPRTVMYDPVDSSGPDKRFHHWGQDMGSARYFIDCITNVGDLVLDPFCGGGTYPLVCQAIGRDYLGCDIDPIAVETTRSRLRNPLFIPAGNQMRFEFAL